MTVHRLDPVSLRDDLCRCDCHRNHPTHMPVCHWTGSSVYYSDICYPCGNAIRDEEPTA